MTTDKISNNSKNSLANKNKKFLEILQKEINQMDELIKTINFEFIDRELSDARLKSKENKKILNILIKHYSSYEKGFLN